MKNKQPIVIITMNPKDSNIYRKLASRLTFDSYGVERGYERFFFYETVRTQRTHHFPPSRQGHKEIPNASASFHTGNFSRKFFNASNERVTVFISSSSGSKLVKRVPFMS